MAKEIKVIDGNEAAAHISYAFTEVAGIYPITPSSNMAEWVDEWAAKGKKNLFGQAVRVVEMQSEAGAAATCHGALQAGALSTTYTASQGLLLMIPTMYKMAGELLPGVLHVSARAVAAHALSIFGDHSDVMACRQTGFAFLASSNPQQVMDLGAVAHMSSIQGRVPFVQFFDGFRTSHEMQKVEMIDYDDLNKIVDHDAIRHFRDNALNPEHPVLRGTAQNPDIFFQAKEASNAFYDDLPAIVEENMKKINALTGRNYQLFNYYGCPDAEHIIVAMGSVCDTIEETIDYLNARGEKVGMVNVHLYRPFSIKHLLNTIPASVKKITVLDRCKEPGALGEPLYQDVITAFAESKSQGAIPLIVGGRYGLGSKDVFPSQIIAVFDNMKGDKPVNHFTVGIEDDVTHLSLPVGPYVDVIPADTMSCKFWGLGSDGTVSANKNAIKIIGDTTDLNSQAYFSYDSKKSGGITQSHLRFGKQPIRSPYLVKTADFVACHNPSYVDKYDMLRDLKDGGTFLLNCLWSDAEIAEKLPAHMKKEIAQRNIKFYAIDGIGIANELGLGRRINTILQAAFFKLTNIIDIKVAVDAMKEAATKSYGHRGDDIIKMNHAAVDAGISKVREVNVPVDWANLEIPAPAALDVPDFIKDVAMPVNAIKGDFLPVSAFKGREDGTFPQGTAAYEKRMVAVDVPRWIPENCIQCNQCSYVCPHATIRPFLLSDEEAKAAPEGYKMLDGKGKGIEDYKYTIGVSMMDCYGCAECVRVCPAKEKAIVMEPVESELAEQPNWTYSMGLAEKPNPMNAFTVKGSQFEVPLLEFSGACAGCGETPYAKLVTQLYGDRMYIGNATGCSSIWGGSAPSTPYTTNQAGKGPAWANSLFEDTAEFSLGFQFAVKQRRNKLLEIVEQIVAEKSAPAEMKEAGKAWMAAFNDGTKTREASENLRKANKKALADCMAGTCKCDKHLSDLYKHIADEDDMLVKKSVWAFGGDGWAYDIGFSGLDHAIASGEDVNMLVFDTEVYS
ncbi:MAG: pyruvate:ferredoxin (flavodoxin) oxidoreductase, partial [Defluviitaleaceae bacterium]|nr:pyruvate:ferredoxin (flavodoxin) oxidoreductase [Defluviitaleaceae bacterium]